jgi:hypothetical protein
MITASGRSIRAWPVKRSLMSAALPTAVIVLPVIATAPSRKIRRPASTVITQPAVMIMSHGVVACASVMAAPGNLGEMRSQIWVTSPSAVKRRVRANDLHALNRADSVRLLLRYCC